MYNTGILETQLTLHCFEGRIEINSTVDQVKSKIHVIIKIAKFSTLEFLKN